MFFEGSPTKHIPIYGEDIVLHQKRKGILIIQKSSEYTHL